MRIIFGIILLINKNFVNTIIEHIEMNEVMKFKIQMQMGLKKNYSKSFKTTM